MATTAKDESAAPNASRNAAADGDGVRLPDSLARFILDTTGHHQVLVSILTVAVFLLELAPLELQRRIVNELTDRRDYRTVVLLAAAYAGLVLVQGGIKLGLNVYRNWISESSTRMLRRKIKTLMHPDGAATAAPQSGVEAAMVVAEVEPIGGFIGSSVSEPLLQFGILFTVIGYLAFLEPWMAGLTFAIFLPHILVVPLMQKAINARTALRVQALREVSIGIVAPARGDQAISAAASGLIDRVFELNMGIYKLKFSMNFVMNFTHHLEVVGALLLGGWLVLAGHIEMGTVVAFISAIGRLNDPWGDLVNYFRDVSSTLLKYRLVTEAVATLGSGRPEPA